MSYDAPLPPLPKKHLQAHLAARRLALTGDTVDGIIVLGQPSHAALLLDPLAKLSAELWTSGSAIQETEANFASARGIQPFPLAERYHTSAHAAGLFWARSIIGAVCGALSSEGFVPLSPEDDALGDVAAWKTEYAEAMKRYGVLGENLEAGPSWPRFRQKYCSTAPRYDLSQIETALRQEAIGVGKLPATNIGHKRSTERDEGRIKIIAALTAHHQYANSGCLNLAPIGNNRLAQEAKVSKATVSRFLKKQFGGYAKYRAACKDPGRFAFALKILNGELSPDFLYGRNPPQDRELDQD